MDDGDDNDGTKHRDVDDGVWKNINGRRLESSKVKYSIARHTRDILRQRERD